MPIRLAIGLVAGQFPDRIQFQRNELHFSEKLASWGRCESRYQKNFRIDRAPRTRLRLTHHGRIQPTFEGEFSNVTRSYAGKGAVRYAW